MMEKLRTNILKRIFAFLLLSVLALKVFAFSISYFSLSTAACAIEKNAEENKDKEEEAFDKNKKKLLLCESYAADTAHYFYISHSPLSIQHCHSRMNTPPTKTVPTPPPDRLS